LENWKFGKIKKLCKIILVFFYDKKYWEFLEVETKIAALFQADFLEN